MMLNELSLETDQTGCFDESGKATSCLNSGQDGAVNQARRIEGPDRFRAADDIVQDNMTGLFWHINANLTEFPLTWKEAFEFITQRGFLCIGRSRVTISSAGVKRVSA